MKTAGRYFNPVHLEVFPKPLGASFHTPLQLESKDGIAAQCTYPILTYLAQIFIAAYLLGIAGLIPTKELFQPVERDLTGNCCRFDAW